MLVFEPIESAAAKLVFASPECPHRFVKFSLVCFHTAMSFFHKTHVLWTQISVQISLPHFVHSINEARCFTNVTAVKLVTWEQKVGELIFMDRQVGNYWKWKWGLYVFD